MRFNEAVGYYRRKLPAPAVTGPYVGIRSVDASMRPSDITDGNHRWRPSDSAEWPIRFNEAVGYYRRKPSRAAQGFVRVSAIRKASMRPSDITDGNAEIEA